MGLLIAGSALGVAAWWARRKSGPTPPSPPPPSPAPSPSPSPAPAPAPPPASPSGIDLSDPDTVWSFRALTAVHPKDEVVVRKRFEQMVPTARQSRQWPHVLAVHALALRLGEPVPSDLPPLVLPITAWAAASQDYALRLGLTFAGGLPGRKPYHDPSLYHGNPFGGQLVRGEPRPWVEPAPSSPPSSMESSPPVPGSPSPGGGSSSESNWLDTIKEWGSIRGVPVPTDVDVTHWLGRELGKQTRWTGRFLHDLTIGAPHNVGQAAKGVTGVGVGLVDELTRASKEDRQRHKTELDAGFSAVLGFLNPRNSFKEDVENARKQRDIIRDA